MMVVRRDRLATHTRLYPAGVLSPTMSLSSSCSVVSSIHQPITPPENLLTFWLPRFKM